MPDQGIKKPSYRVNRGGSWYYSASALRASNRDRVGPSVRLDYLGFRLVEEVQDVVEEPNSRPEYRVFRGGGWINRTASALRASVRDRNDPSYRYGNLGFRLVEEVKDEDR